MTVRGDDSAIHLEGRCLVDDAEILLVALQQNPGLPVDVTKAERLHMAVVQILLALKPELRGTAADPFIARHMLGGLKSG